VRGRRGVSETLLLALAATLPTSNGSVDARLRELDAAFRDLDESLAEREVRLSCATYFADFAPLWKDPRLEAVLVRMGVRSPVGA
jgi:hypothetical protein